MGDVTAVVEAAPAPPTAPGRAASVLAGSLATAAAAVTVLASFTALTGGNLEVAGPRVPAGLLLVEVAAVAVMVAGMWTVRGEHAPVSTALAVATAGSLVPTWAGWPWLPGPVRAGMLAVGPFTVAGVAHVALCWPTRPSAGARSAGQAVSVLVTAAALSHLLGYNPFADPGCALICEDIRPLLENLLTTRFAVTVTCLLGVAAAAVATVAVVAGRAPRAPRGVVGTVALALAGLAALPAVRWASWADRSPSLPLLALEPLVVAAVAAVAAAVTIRTLRTRAAIDRLGLQLSNPETAVRDVSGAIRGVQFAMPGGSRWVDAAGRNVPDAQAGGNAVVLSDASGPVLRLLLAGRTDPGEILAGLTPATRLALRNGQLAAVAAARLAEVQASQRRVVALSDAERRRIERDLHDGAQQRLVSVAFHLGAAMSRVDQAVAERLAGPYAQVRAALVHLRQLAHGIVPGVLVDEGLPAALDELAAASDVPVILDVRAGELPDAVAMAAYATVVAALESIERPSTTTRARISVVQDAGMVAVRAEVTIGDGDVRRPDYTDAADRVGALGGRLTDGDVTADGITVTAVIPCAS